jgi:PPM family protein phosphatase
MRGILSLFIVNRPLEREENFKKFMEKLGARSAGLSDAGLKREINEDYYENDNSFGLYVVADGMGGHLAGDVASKFAVNIIQKYFRQLKTENTPLDELFGLPESSLSLWGNYVLASVKLANRILYDMSQEYPRYKGMGTTIAVIALMNSAVIAANVGDSKIYLIRGDTMEPLSKSHTMMAEQLELGLISSEEAKTSPLRHILTRSLGSRSDVEVDVFEIETMAGDSFLLCTDGLTDLVADKDILTIIKSGDEQESICNRLVSEANNRGGIDNITVSFISLNGVFSRKKGMLGKFFQIFNRH